MSNYPRHFLLLKVLTFLIIIALTVSCGARSDLALRYKMEKSLNAADKLQQQYRIRQTKLTDIDFKVLVDRYELIAGMINEPRTSDDVIQASDDRKLAWDLSAKAMTRIGDLYRERRIYDRALEYYARVKDNIAINLDERIAVLGYLAGMAEEQRHFLNASALYDSLGQIYLMAINPNNPNFDALDAPLKSANMLLKQNDMDQYDCQMQLARDYYEQIIDKYHGTLIESAAIGKLAASYIQENKYSDAVDVLNKVRTRNNGTLTPHVMLTIGELYLNDIKDYGKAEATFNDFIKAYPDDANICLASLGLGYSLYQQKKFPEARRAIDDIEKDPKASPEIASKAYFLAGLCYEKEDKWDLARAQFNFVEATFPGEDQAFEAALYIPNHYRSKGQTDFARSSFNDALEYINKAINRNSSDKVATAKALGYLVRAYAENGNAQKAIDELELLHDQYPKQPEGAYAPLKIADISEKNLGDTAKAISWLRIYINDNPDADSLDEIKGHIQMLESLNSKKH